MFHISVVFGCIFAFASTIQCEENSLVLPYERLSIDDCNVRFYKHAKPSVVFPAGGTSAFLREFAHIAAIGRRSEDRTSVRWFCAGSLIWENFILTAAHCAADYDNIPPNVARMGDINIYSDEDDEFAQELEIVEIIRHPNHRFSSSYYDIALMKLERNVSVHDTVAPTCLWLDDEIRFPELLAAGWGRTGFSEEQSNILLKVQLTPISNENCSSYYAKGDRKYRKGLLHHQLCAGDEKMDTCPGDSGGPLHVKLFHDWKMIPFLVGVTSFGKACGVSAPGVYVRVSQFAGWIIDTLQRHGEMATYYKFEPMVCANRYYNLREYKEDVKTTYKGVEQPKWGSQYFSKSISDYLVALRWSNPYDAVKLGCTGTLIEPNVVLTLAVCVLPVFGNKKVWPTHAILANGHTLEVADVIVHPSYNIHISPYYNNIAVVKLKSYDRIEPFCVWYGEPNPGAKVFLTGRRVLTNEYTEKSFSSVVMTRVWERSSDQCRLAELYFDSLPQGLQDEHLCYENQPFLVPGSCDLMLGSPMEKEGKDNIYINGINLFGRDCGYGEPAVGVRLSAHKKWLESVLLPRSHDESLVFIDPDLKLNDPCENADQTHGTCVAKEDCQAFNSRRQSKQLIVFCGDGNIVCCPETSNSAGMIAIQTEFNECEERYRHLRTGPQQGIWPHIVEIRWKNDAQIRNKCYGYLISTRGVVTSASCLQRNRTPPKFVRIGGIRSGNASQTVRIGRAVSHPNYNSTTLKHNIAILRLKADVDPTENAFPGCLWQNITHSPVVENVLNVVSKRFDPIHPMYKSDCEALLNRTFDESGTLCMNLGTKTYEKMMSHYDLHLHIKPLEHVPKKCYQTGNPIVWRQSLNGTFGVDYLVHVYSNGSCDSNTPRLVSRVASYIEWFKVVLQ